MNRSLTRKQLLERAALGGAALTLPGFLAACGGGGGETAAATTARQAARAARRHAPVLELAALHRLRREDEEATRRSSSSRRRRASRSTTSRTSTTTPSYFGKIQRPLSQGQSIDRDIIVLTDNSRFPGLLIEKGWAEQLDKSAIPNIKNLQDSLAHPSFDPDREYSLPWQSGMTGIATNTKLTGGKPVTTIDQLLEDPKLKGKVTLLTEMADSIALVMLANGDDPTKVDDASFEARARPDPEGGRPGQIRQFTGNDYSGPLAKGDLPRRCPGRATSSS